MKAKNNSHLTLNVFRFYALPAYCTNGGQMKKPPDFSFIWKKIHENGHC